MNNFVIKYPYYKATPSNNCPELFCNDSLPELKEYNGKDNIIIFEPWEADIPGPEMSSGKTVIQDITDKLKHINKDKITFITANLDCKSVPFANTVKYYPYHFLEIQRTQKNLEQVNTTREKHFCSLNGAIKHKRIEFIKFCEQNNLIKNNYVSLVGNYNHGFKTDTEYKNYYLDKTAEQLNLDDKSIPLDIFDNSYLNLINETHEDDHVFFTEKTWKPILNYQLFLYYGCSDPEKYYWHLEKLGIRLYKEILDYTNNPLQELLKFCNTPIKEIQKQFKAIHREVQRNSIIAKQIDCETIKKRLLT